MAWAKPLKKLLYTLPAPAFWLGVWQLCAFLVDRHVGGRGNELLLPYPVSVWSALVSLAGTSRTTCPSRMTTTWSQTARISWRR